ERVVPPADDVEAQSASLGTAGGVEDRGDDAGDHGVDDRGDRRADDDGDSEVDDVPAHDEVTESLEHGCSSLGWPQRGPGKRTVARLWPASPPVGWPVAQVAGVV